MMNKPISILLYEDNALYRDSFKLIAQRKRILVDAVDNVEVLIETLESNPRKHKFVVLDAKAYLHEGQTSQESEDYLHKVFRELERIAKKQDRLLPYCINTGFADIKLRFNEVLECPIYEKGSEEDLINYIWETYNNTDAAVLRRDYPDVFEFADTYFDDASLELLSNLLHKKRFESNSLADRVENLARLRRLNEHLMDILRHEHLKVELSDITNNAGRRTIEIIDYLRNVRGENVPGHITNSVKDIYYTASEFGSHSVIQAETVPDYPSSYGIVGLTNGFLETILWLKKKIN